MVMSFINILFYFIMYALFDNMVELLGWTNLSPGFLNFTKLLMLIILGFLIGLVGILLFDIGTKKACFERSYFDIKSLVILGFIPSIGLLLSGGSITNFFVSRFFGSNKELTEIFYYLFSRNTIWSIWLGFSIGASVRLAFRKKFKSKMIYDGGGGSTVEFKNS